MCKEKSFSEIREVAIAAIERSIILFQESDGSNPAVYRASYHRLVGQIGIAELCGLITLDEWDFFMRRLNEIRIF